MAVISSAVVIYNNSSPSTDTGNAIDIRFNDGMATRTVDNSLHVYKTNSSHTTKQWNIYSDNVISPEQLGLNAICLSKWMHYITRRSFKIYKIGQIQLIIKVTKDRNSSLTFLSVFRPFGKFKMKSNKIHSLRPACDPQLNNASHTTQEVSSYGWEFSIVNRTTGYYGVVVLGTARNGNQIILLHTMERNSKTP
ncbi:hypothetical protein GOBAR_AA14635 [Gossypium barbadense]|uniref:Uncharacterized protein n=1 Tax=Gossypium barbadense TaxID=3634 RepID=A0A2P5XRR3_GOSBA|nr:hypothetical protein GOBAR_AA14635 [Gossypium barbadense]